MNLIKIKGSGCPATTEVTATDQAEVEDDSDKKEDQASGAIDCTMSVAQVCVNQEG